MTNPLVSLVDGKPVTTSLEIAERFDKRHDNVVRDIKEILSQVVDSSENLKIEGFGESNFRQGEYTITNNLGFEVKKPMYIITRDGFMLLAMGFTGKAALQWKVRFIEAFNAMEAALNHPQVQPVAEEYLSPAQYHELKRLVSVISSNFHYTQAAPWNAWSYLRRTLGVESANKIPATRYEEARGLLEDLNRAAFAFKSKVLECEKLFFKRRFGEVPPELSAIEHEQPQLALRG